MSKARLVWDHNELTWKKAGKAVKHDVKDWGSDEELERAIKIELTNAVRKLVNKGEEHMVLSNIYKYVTKKGFHKSTFQAAWGTHKDEILALVFNTDSVFLMEMRDMPVKQLIKAAKKEWPDKPPTKTRVRTAASQQEAYVKQQLRELLKTAKGAKKKKIEERLRALNK